MKKIMFSDKFGLTKAVLDGRKTQTRRIIKMDSLEFYALSESYGTTAWKAIEKSIMARHTRYKVGEVVAVAQSYKDAGVNYLPEEDDEFGCYNFPAEQTNGWTNKMFVRADLMPHQIRITNVRVERLQDISDEDCIKEGIWMAENVGFQGVSYWYPNLCNSKFKTPREAYAALIDRISGKGTFESNPYVFVYEFELIK